MHFIVRTVNYEFERYRRSIECNELYNSWTCKCCPMFFYYGTMFIIIWSICLYLDWAPSTHSFILAKKMSRVKIITCKYSLNLHLWNDCNIIFFVSAKCTNHFPNANNENGSMTYEFMPLKRICQYNWQNES